MSPFLYYSTEFFCNIQDCGHVLYMNIKKGSFVRDQLCVKCLVNKLYVRDALAEISIVFIRHSLLSSNCIRSMRSIIITITLLNVK